MPKLPTGLILFEGPSKLNREPIVVIATGFSRKSKNEKTGDLIQTWILVNNGHVPLINAFSLEDEAVCGDCPLRGYYDSRTETNKTGMCYVNTAKAPGNVYKAYLRGVYELLDKRAHAPLFHGRTVRFGSYGDPAAVPLNVWRWVSKQSKRWVGYTHQWRKCHHSYSYFCMASCETELDRLEAKELGYRTFRIRTKGGPLLESEVACPADKHVFENPRTCATCKACSGAKTSPRAVDIAITVHGEPWKAKRFEQSLIGSI